MGVVLAIDPGRRQGKALDRLTREFDGHEVVVATSGAEALAVLDGVLPDLVLFPLFLAPGDESRLQSRLQALSDPSDRRALTIPLRTFFDGETQATRPAAVPPRWFYWFRPPTSPDQVLSDPRAFADAIRAEVNRPRVERRGDDDMPGVPLIPLAASQPESNAAAATIPQTPAPLSSPTVVVSPLPVVVSVPDPSAVEAASFEPASPRPVDLPPPPTWTPSPRYGSMFDMTADGPEEVPEDGSAGRPDRLAAVGAAAASVGRGAVGLGRAVTKVGPAAVAVWRLAQRTPRSVQVGAPIAAILLSLGVTGHVGTILSSPGRWVGQAQHRWFPPQPKSGMADIQTVPEGAQVWYQGRQLGVTPLKTEFAVGSHDVELRYRNTTRTITLDVTAGGTIVQRIEWAAPRVAGKLRVESDPPGATVFIDGKQRGVTPLQADDVTAGRHAVDVTMNGNTVHETVDVKAGRTATLRTSIYQGWLAVFSPIDVKLSAGGRALTLDDQNRVMLPSGAHELTLQNRALGYTDSRTIEIKPGDTTPVSVVLPKTTLTIITSSPAEVWIDGERAGEAPITDLPVDIGTRQVTVRSTEHGERQATVTATMNPARVTIDFATSTP